MSKNTLLKRIATIGLASALTFAGGGIVGLAVNEFLPRPHKAWTKIDLQEDSEDVLLARMIYGEARGCDINEQIAVGYTAVNRANDGVKWNGENVKEAVLKKSQYSCFNDNDPNLGKLLDPEKRAYWNYFKGDGNRFNQCLDVARDILNGNVEDPTNGATHYCRDFVNPSWKSKIENLGKVRTSDGGESKHTFYRE